MKLSGAVARLSFLSVLTLRFAFGQLNSGEIRVSVTDPAGLALPSNLSLVSEASRTHRDVKTNDAGQFTFQHLPFGNYHLTITHSGFAPFSTMVDVDSAVPHEIKAQLNVQAASTEVV